MKFGLKQNHEIAGITNCELTKMRGSPVVVYTQSVSGYIPNEFLVKSLIPNYNLYYKMSMI